MANNLTVQVSKLEAIINEVENEYLRFADRRTMAQESMFAIQAFQNNDYLAQIATKNPSAVTRALINAASLSLTLNPVLGLCYLVPRKNQVVLDISYKGLKSLAIREGLIKNLYAENVYAEDDFKYNGKDEKPIHKFDPFASVKERGDYRGSYCVALMADGSTYTEVMSSEDIYKIRNLSEYYKNSKAGPWVDFFDRMALKSVVRRACKSWPVNYSAKLGEAIRTSEIADDVVISDSGLKTIPETQAVIIDENKVNEGAINFSEKLIKRLKANGLSVVNEARNLANTRYSGADLKFILDKIDEFEKEEKSNSQEESSAEESTSNEAQSEKAENKNEDKSEKSKQKSEEKASQNAEDSLDGVTDISS